MTAPKDGKLCEWTLIGPLGKFVITSKDSGELLERGERLGLVGKDRRDQDVTSALHITDKQKRVSCVSDFSAWILELKARHPLSRMDHATWFLFNHIRTQYYGVDFHGASSLRLSSTLVLTESTSCRTGRGPEQLLPTSQSPAGADSTTTRIREWKQQGGAPWTREAGARPMDAGRIGEEQDKGLSECSVPRGPRSNERYIADIFANRDSRRTQWTAEHRDVDYWGLSAILRRSIMEKRFLSSSGRSLKRPPLPFPSG